MLVEAENKLLDGGGRKGGIEGFCARVLEGLKADELKDVGDVGLALNTFRFDTVGRIAG